MNLEVDAPVGTLRRITFFEPHGSPEVHLTWRRCCTTTSNSISDVEQGRSTSKMKLDAVVQHFHYAVENTRDINMNRYSMSLLSCFDDGEFNIEAYLKQCNRKRAAAVEDIVELCLNAAEEEEKSMKSSTERRVCNDIRGQMPKKLDSDAKLCLLPCSHGKDQTSVSSLLLPSLDLS